MGGSSLGPSRFAVASASARAAATRELAPPRLLRRPISWRLDLLLHKLPKDPLGFDGALDDGGGAGGPEQLENLGVPRARAACP